MFVADGARVADKINPWARVSAKMLIAFGAEYFGYDAILLIGDSRVAGLGHRSVDQPRSIVFNMGVSGSTASQWRTFLQHLHVPYPKVATTVIWLGVNDFIHDAASAQVVAQNLRHLATTLNSSGHRVFVLDQIALDSKAGSIDPSANIRGQELNALFEAKPFTTATLVRISDIFEPTAGTNSTPQLSDGIHLRSRANEQVWRRITLAVVATRIGHRK